MNKKAVDWEKVKPMMSGGLMLGGGVGAAVALYKLLGRLNDNRRKENDTSYDDDTLYLTTPQPDEEDAKVANEKKATTPTDVLVGSVGGLLAAYVGYKGVDAIYTKVRKNRLQSELDEAQNIYLDRLQTSKTASMKKEAIGSSIDRMGAGAMAIPLLVALGAGLITNRVLSKANPKIKKPGKTGLRKIVLKSPKSKKKVNEQTKELTPEAPKENVSEEDLQNLMQLSMAKSSGLRDIVHDNSLYGGKALNSNFKEYGLFTAMDMAKGTEDSPITEAEKNASIKQLSENALMQDSIALHCASEFFDMSPTLCKNASLLEDSEADALIDFTREFLRDVNKNNHCKRAASTSLAMQLLTQPDQSNDGLQIGSSEDSESVKREDEDDDSHIDGIHLDATDDAVKEFLAKYRDIIDSALDVK